MTSSNQTEIHATKEEVEAKVREYWADANIKGASATKEFEYLNGFVWSVVIIDAKDKNHLDYCYTIRKNIDRYGSLGELVRATGRKRNIMSLIYSILDVGGIAGILAIIITITLCGMALFNLQADQKVIAALTLALGSVMGFYFGKRSNPTE